MDSRIREAVRIARRYINEASADSDSLVLDATISEERKIVEEALALLDAPVASNARNLADEIYTIMDNAYFNSEEQDEIEAQTTRRTAWDEATIKIESFAAERERKAREETARKCAEVIRCKVEGGPKCPDGGDLFHTYMDGVGDAVEAACAAIMEATHE